MYFIMYILNTYKSYEFDYDYKCRASIVDNIL